MALFGTACEQLHDDNRAAPIFGAENGQLPGGRLVNVNGCTVYWEAAVSLKLMMQAAADDGVKLTPTSCYRDLAGQISARNYWCGLSQCHMAAVPGSSNHGWGKAVDFRNGSLPMTYDSEAFKWLTAYGWHYGWFHPKAMRQGGPVPEPWHWEWIGDGGRMFHGKYFGFGNALPLQGSPLGSLDVVAPRAGGALVQGWTFDPDQQDPIDVHVYVNGQGVGAWRAGSPRPDVGAAFPAYASRPHGFSLRLPLANGPNEVCVYGIEAHGTGTSTLLGCRSVFADNGFPLSGSPIGALDAVRPVQGGARVLGWAIDPDRSEPIDVHVYVNGQGVGGWKAGAPRGDVARAFPAYAAHPHGYDLPLALAPGRHTVCVYAINAAGTGSHTLLGCRAVTVDPPASIFTEPEPVAPDAPDSTTTPTTVPTSTTTATTTPTTATTTTTQAEPTTGGTPGGSGD
nr:M15 family metallopeptidase [Rhabdothermincola salaria]